MNKSGLADSPFFTPPPKKVPVSPPSIELSLRKGKMEKSHANNATVKPRNRDTVVSSNHATMPPQNHDTTIEVVRKAVKVFGKEAATHRFTPEEKNALLDIIYSYKGHGTKTSENEITRIAINYICEDYKRNGKNSVLDKVLKALNE